MVRLIDECVECMKEKNDKTLLIKRKTKRNKLCEIYLTNINTREKRFNQLLCEWLLWVSVHENVFFLIKIKKTMEMVSFFTKETYIGKFTVCVVLGHHNLKGEKKETNFEKSLVKSFVALLWQRMAADVRVTVAARQRLIRFVWRPNPKEY